MLVNAENFAGPALWQGIMLCMMPAVLWGMFYKDGLHMRWAIGAYVVFGATLLVAISIA